jgi:hypothetical protein
MPLLHTPRPARTRALRRLVAAGAALCTALGAGACNDPLTQTAALSVASDTLIVAALSGTGPNARSALLLRNLPTVVSPEGTVEGDFHVALDINAQGQAVVYPAQLVSTVTPRRVAIRRIDGLYDSLATAPTGSYDADSALTVAPGQIVGVRVPGLGTECLYTGRPYFYSKLVVDSVRLSERLLFVRATTDPNCGVRSFAAGIPRD